MTIFEELLALDWPGEYAFEFADETKEGLFRGRGIAITPADDDPEGCGFQCADLPAKHPRNQMRGGRLVRFTELRGIYALDGRRLWPPA